VSAGEDSPRAIIAALLANVGIAIMKFVAFLLTQSASMLAESIHSLADSGNQLLLLLGRRQARRRPDVLHPFGYGRERYVYAFVVSIVLFSLGGLFALYEGYHKVHEPHPIEAWKWVPIVVLAGAICLEGFSFRTATSEARPNKGDGSWFDFIRRARSPELPVVILEDFAALTGLAIALVGVGLSLITGNGVFDGIGSLAIGALLVSVAVVLAIETKSLLVGESAEPGTVDAINTALVETAGVQRVIHLRTMHLGPDELLVGAKIAVDEGSSLAAVALVIDAAEARIRAVAPTAGIIYLEPDVDRDSQHDLNRFNRTSTQNQSSTQSHLRRQHPNTPDE
jgi:cation diffusion facilitator family transporter